MNDDRFQICVQFVLDHETEYDSDGNAICEHDSNDPGGATKYGIDQRSHPSVDVCGLTLDEAKEIYHDNEWTKCCCAELPTGFDLAVFDAAVNLGMGWAIKALQEVVGSTVDGFIGPKTIAATQAAPASALDGYLSEREDHYRSLPTNLRLHYLKGWLNRVADLRSVVQPTGTQVA